MFGLNASSSEMGENVSSGVKFGNSGRATESDKTFVAVDANIDATNICLPGSSHYFERRELKDRGIEL